jgi:hypothetical protein
MSDIRGYSGIAETIDPAQLAAQLNEHRSAMNHVIMNHAGIVMQYMGDAVFAAFGPTISPGQHADQAFAAAHEMHSQQNQINEAWTSRSQPIFGIGIGLSTRAGRGHTARLRRTPGIHPGGRRRQLGSKTSGVRAAGRHDGNEQNYVGQPDRTPR